MPAATATKVKLPSISELTSNLTPQSDPLQNIISSTPARHFQRQHSYDLMQPPPPVSSSYYSYGQAPPHLQYSSPHYVPVYYPSPPMVSSPSAKPASDYRVPEIINKPMNKCHRCETTETPEWRRGPNGLRTLCNACGLFHAKLVRRKGAAWAAEEVLNNKVCKGKNGRRISVKKQALDESKKRSKQAQVIEIPPLPHQQQQQQKQQQQQASPPASSTPVSTSSSSSSPVYHEYPVYR
ncbi:uncharacterized protein CXQ87_004952 [Candidozyma duobushaemuli]|uniref:GATA-type domain-containing protein n=1 Tax=Candidozyma duobushaemuli TaxID=1231522 RepID=A0A2V1AGG5_9ASCO|nr:uncharacterized protein CXQ87_004952 [[Candida] duobushaemulonis]PVH16656.1 hypothetical protein CXQ87_004952 [[Candida] duobushaemulonis]